MAFIARPILPDPRIAGVAFTGSTQTAHIINRSLAARNEAILPLIAETGGMNAMIVDSSALPEQAVRDLKKDLHESLQSLAEVKSIAIRMKRRSVGSASGAGSS